MAIWQATNVSIPNNSSIITVNTGDDVGNLFTGAIVQVNNLQLMTVKTVNTGASPQTIEIDELYTGSAVSGGTAIGAPTQGAIKEAAEELRLLRTTYENLADTVSTTGTANSLAKRTSTGRLKAADGSDVDDVVTVGQFESLETYQDYGVGVDYNGQPNNTVTDGQNLPSGLHRISGSSTNTAGVLSGALLKMAVQSGREVQLIGGVDNEWYGVAQKDGVYSNPVNFYHSGNSVNPVDYGIGRGRELASGVDLDTFTASGFYAGKGSANTSASAGDNPYPSKNGAFGIITTGDCVDVDDGDYNLQIVGNLQGPSITPSLKFRNIGLTANGWTDWNELYHSGNSVNPIDHGLRVDGTLPQLSYSDTVSGFFKNVSDNKNIITLGRAPTRMTSLEFESGGQSANTWDIQAVHYDGTDGNEYARVDLYHSGNTNFNEFGGLAERFDDIGVGFSVTSTTIRFYLPIQSKTAPSSITTVGTFQVGLNATGDYIGIGSSRISLSSVSSNKLACIDIGGFTGLTAGDSFNLRTESTTSKITVNF